MHRNILRRIIALPPGKVRRIQSVGLAFRYPAALNKRKIAGDFLKLRPSRVFLRVFTASLRCRPSPAA